MPYGILPRICLKPGIRLLTLAMLWLSTSTVDAARFVLSDGTSVHMNLSSVGKYFQALGSMVGRVEDTGEAISLTGVSMVQLRMVLLPRYRVPDLLFSDVEHFRASWKTICKGVSRFQTLAPTGCSIC